MVSPVLFLRCFSLIYVMAFASLWVQVTALIGEQGVLPAKNFFQALKHAGVSFGEMPSVVWWNQTDAFLIFLCAAGVAVAVALFFAIYPSLCALVLWVCYLSLTIAAQDFYSFQWDNLLLEAGFILVFLCSWGASRGPDVNRVSVLVLWCFRLLLFKLMLQSGLVKLLSKDPVWANATALTYHYWTQPLPNVVSWYADQLPLWFHKLSWAVVFAVELALPFFMFFGRTARQIAFWGLTVFQALIIITGNYTFFNLLTIVLCLPLLMDPVRQPLALPHRIFSMAATALIVFMTVTQTVNFAHRHGLWARFSLPEPVKTAARLFYPWRSFNNYGLFAVMTTTRREIILEGSQDGQDWQAYEFFWKPGALERAPGWVMPHQPRLDWQMWFAALGNYQDNPWLLNLAVRLLQGSPSVLKLLKNNPFPEAPPRLVRASVYEYRFTDAAARQKTGAWWQRESKGIYLPPVSLNP